MNAYIGLNAKGETRLFVSSFELNEVGPRNQRGTMFPESVYAFQGEGTGDPLRALEDAQKYFDKEEGKKKR